MTIRDIYKKHISALKDIYADGEAAAIADIIFEYYTGITGTKMIIAGNEIPSEDINMQLDRVLDKLIQHIPVQYITGEAYFCGLRFFVNNAVLIPRPETEELVHEVYKLLQNNNVQKIIDIGTGSGCIPVSIKKKFPDADLSAVDISPDALEVARTNAASNVTDIHFIEMNFLEDKNYESLPVFDIIISNPPYIPEEEEKLLDKNVTLHEPRLALFVPQNDPLIFYKKIKQFADDHLKKQGYILLEVHENLAKKTAEIFSAGEYQTETKKDMSGKERMLIIYRCP